MNWTNYELEADCRFQDHYSDLLFSAIREYDREMVEDKLFANWNGQALLITEDGEMVFGKVEYIADEMFYWFESDNKKYDLPVEEL